VSEIIKMRIVGNSLVVVDENGVTYQFDGRPFSQMTDELLADTKREDIFTDTVIAPQIKNKAH